MVAKIVNDPRLTVRYSDEDTNLEDAMVETKGTVWHDPKTDFVAPDPEYKDRAPPPSATSVFRVRVVYFSIVALTLLITWWRITSSASIKSILVNPSLYEDHMPPPDADPQSSGVSVEFKEMCAHIDPPTPECLDAAAPPPPIDYYWSASHARRNMMATLSFSQICDIITGSFFILATGTGVLLTYHRTCGMKDAELRGMAICVLACVSMAFSIIGTIVSATVFADKRAEVNDMLPRGVLLDEERHVAKDMLFMLYLQIGGGLLACASHVMLGIIAVYYVDEFTGDSLYLPVKSFAKTSVKFFGW